MVHSPRAFTAFTIFTLGLFEGTSLPSFLISVLELVAQEFV